MPDRRTMKVPITPMFVVNGLEPKAEAPAIEEFVQYQTVNVDPLTVSHTVSQVEIELGHERGLLEAVSRRMVHEVENLIMREFGGLPPKHRPALGPSTADMARILTREMLQKTVRTYTWGTEAPRTPWFLRQPRYEPLIPDAYHRQVQGDEMDRFTLEYMNREGIEAARQGPGPIVCAVDPARAGAEVTARLQRAYNTTLIHQMEMLRGRPAFDPHIPPWAPPSPADIARKEEERKVRLVAESKGWQLVHDILGDEDYQRFKRQGYVDIQSSKHPGTGYRIREGKRIGVLKMPPGMKQPIEHSESLCVGPPNQWSYVSGDNVATHILMCKFNEELLLTTAIRWQYGAVPVPSAHRVGFYGSLV